MNSSSCATSPSTRCVNTTSCPSTGARTWATFRAAVSSPACRSSRLVRELCARRPGPGASDRRSPTLSRRVSGSSGRLSSLSKPSFFMCMSMRGISKPGSSTVTGACIMRRWCHARQMMASSCPGSRERVRASLPQLASSPVPVPPGAAEAASPCRPGARRSWYPQHVTPDSFSDGAATRT